MIYEKEPEIRIIERVRDNSAGTQYYRIRSGEELLILADVGGLSEFLQRELESKNTTLCWNGCIKSAEELKKRCKSVGLDTIYFGRISIQKALLDWYSNQISRGKNDQA